ncbi:uncharacterized protein LOC116339851 [Contarinia nasturtii]|uniref:uncharacterized protein LOC116339851 n=1 Tax=Contarinia nasturtii TaxID=265458 RepID=UPI0012D47021|nr:uncharacterized protein LOC116339851 [Contarinia nasturtii]
MLVSKLVILFFIGVLHSSIANSRLDDDSQAVVEANAQTNKQDKLTNNRALGRADDETDLNSPNSDHHRSGNLGQNNENNHMSMVSIRDGSFGSIGGTVSKIAVDAVQTLQQGETFHMAISKE